MTTKTKNATRKFLVQMLLGGLIGAGAAAGFLQLFGETRLDTANGGTVLAVVAGISYVLMGLLVGFGAMAPTAGARLLNVEDPEELREERRTIGSGALASLLIGVFLLALAMASPAEGREVAAITAALSIAGIIVLTFWTRGTADELTRQINWESSTPALQIGLAVLAAWSALSHLGYAPWIEPLALIASASLLQLATIFWVAGRKGMLVR